MTLSDQEDVDLHSHHLQPVRLSNSNSSFWTFISEQDVYKVLCSMPNWMKVLKEAPLSTEMCLKYKKPNFTWTIVPILSWHLRCCDNRSVPQQLIHSNVLAQECFLLSVPHLLIHWTKIMDFLLHRSPFGISLWAVLFIQQKIKHKFRWKYVPICSEYVFVCGRVCVCLWVCLGVWGWALLRFHRAALDHHVIMKPWRNPQHVRMSDCMMDDYNAVWRWQHAGYYGYSVL